MPARLTEEASPTAHAVHATGTGRRIIVDRQIVEDAYRHLADDEPLPEDGLITVSRARWLGEPALADRPGAGVRYQADENPLEDPWVMGVPLIVLEFPVFSDGRPLTVARKLRRMGYPGQLRAIGDVLRDQLLYMWRCGFDAFEVRADKSIEDALAAFAEFTVDYQPNTPRRVHTPTDPPAA